MAHLIDADALVGGTYYVSQNETFVGYTQQEIDRQPTVEMAKDCISRQATIDAIYKKHIGGKDAIKNAPINDLYACGLEEAVDAVEDMPSVQPQPKRGKWIVHPKGIGAHLICNKCLSNAPYDCKTNYCPKCGAKMEVEDANNSQYTNR